MEFMGVVKILIITLRYIGDVLLTVPTVRAVREKFPLSEIIYLTYPVSGEIIEKNLMINEVWYYDKKKPMPILKKVREHRFDMVICLTMDDRTMIAARYSGARYRIGEDPEGEGFWGKKYLLTHCAPAPDPMKHMVERKLDIVRKFGMDTKDLSLPIYLMDSEKTWADNFLKQNKITGKEILIHCHPVVRLTGKQWKFDRMAEAIDFLVNQPNCRVIVTASGSKNDKGQVAQIKSFLKTHPIFLEGEASLRQVAALSARSDFYFGLDTGIMHIAAAMGRPVVVLFGPTAEHVWGPMGEGHIIIEEPLSCRPCQKDGCNDSGKSDCMEKLMSVKVIEILKEKIVQISASKPA